VDTLCVWIRCVRACLVCVHGWRHLLLTPPSPLPLDVPLRRYRPTVSGSAGSHHCHPIPPALLMVRVCASVCLCVWCVCVCLCVGAIDDMEETTKAIVEVGKGTHTRRRMPPSTHTSPSPEPLCPRSLFTHTHTYAQTLTHTLHTHLHTHTYTHIYTHTHTHIYTNTYTHTHTHTCRRPSSPCRS
jgi:hypothetical protein